MCGDRPRSAAVRIFDGITRKTAPGPFPVHEDVRAESSQPGDLVGEVGVVPARELLFVLPRHDRLEQRGHRRRIERRSGEIEDLNRAVFANERGHADAQMQVGRSLLTHQLEQAVDRCRH